MKDGCKTVLLFIVVIFIIFAIMSCTNSTNSEMINEKVHSIGGEVLDIDLKSYIFDDVPFDISTKEDRIYQFTYLLNDETKVGWFRSRVFGSDWILDYMED